MALSVHSKNKKAMTASERAHVQRVKELACVICDQAAPSEAHEIEQGAWFLSIALCLYCHRHPVLGIHGQKRAWLPRKMDEMKALNETLRRLA